MQKWQEEEKLLLKQISKTNKAVQPSEVYGSLSFSYCDPEMDFSKVIYTCHYSNESEVDPFLSSLYQIDALIRGARRSRSIPFDKDQSYNIYAEFEIDPQPNWHVSIGKFQARFKVKELDT